MSDRAREWWNHTFNPWWGCTEVSPACDNCYARVLSRRFGWSETGNSGPDLWTKDGSRRTFDAKHWAEPDRWNLKAEAARTAAFVFCASMCDVFEEFDEDSDPETVEAIELARAKLWAKIDGTPWLTWMLLTKRPRNIRPTVPPSWLTSWPSNAWVGTTVENQRQAELRLPHLMRVPAPGRFVSAEPLLGPLRLDDVKGIGNTLAPEDEGVFGRVHWVITGGESGASRRPFNADHARQLADQCTASRAAFWFKQGDGLTAGRPGPPDLDDRRERPPALSPPMP